MTQQLLYETHSHTPLCKHAIGEPEEYAAMAERRGLRGLTVTCHNPLPDGHSAHVRMTIDEFDQYVDIVVRAREEWVGRVDVLLGIEADYWPGYESWLAQQMEWADFQYVLGSVHPQTAEYRQRFDHRDTLEAQRTYFQMLAQAAETGLFDSLSHPDLIKNEKSSDWNQELIMPDICRALDRIAKTGIAMELNTSGVNKVIPEMNPFPEMLVEMNRRSIPVTVGADAHEPNRVGAQFEAALDLLKLSGYSYVSHFVNRQRQEILIDDAITSLTAVVSP